ncbi:MAG: hypothetical protein KC503_47670 [Myxococcales bacterium]|nr:hypothetical protein [Myxococcales bacterium]
MQRRRRPTALALALAALSLLASGCPSGAARPQSKPTANKPATTPRATSTAKPEPKPEPKLPPCPALRFDPTAGKLNGLDSKADRAAIKRALPCFTGETPDGKKIGGIEANCGGGVFFTRDHFYFYTGRDYIEVRTGFKGKVGGDLLGASRKTVEGEVGTPNRVEKVAPRTIALYAMTYGTLAVTYDQDGKAIALAAHSTPAQDIKLCK